MRRCADRLSMCCAGEAQLEQRLAVLEENYEGALRHIEALVRSCAISCRAAAVWQSNWQGLHSQRFC